MRILKIGQNSYVLVKPKSTDIGENLDPLDVVFGDDEFSQPVIVAFIGC